jgi:very-short-patch-repair endonuclease
MSRTHEIALANRARNQHGLLRSSDLSDATGRHDEARRRRRSGAWREVLPGVLAPAACEIKPALLASAAMLWDDQAILSHHEAARRSGIWVPEADRLRVTVPFESRRRSLKDLEVVRTRAFPERMHTDGFHRWTRPERSLVDLAMVLTRNQLEAALLSAIRARLTDAAAVAAVAVEVPGRAGLADLRAVTSLWSPERESLLEDRLHEDLLAAVRDEVRRQHRVLQGDGTLIARLDCAIPELLLGFEADGLLFHSTDEQIAADQARDRRLMRLGWLVVRFREDALADRPQVRRDLAAIVGRRRRDVRAA